MILPLALPVWGEMNGTTTVTCTGKAWVELAPGTMQREAVVVAVAHPPLKPPVDESLLACDDGSGKDAPISGQVPTVHRVHSGQIVDRGTLRVIALRSPSDPGTKSAVVIDVNTLAGDDALESKSGKGLILLNWEGITVFPSTYVLENVVDETIYAVRRAPGKPEGKCRVAYVPSEGGGDSKIIESPLDCETILHDVGSDDIFAGRLSPP